MEIVKKWDHKVEEGIYKQSRPVKRYAHIKPIVEDMIKFFDGSEGSFDVVYKTGYALSHCQMDVGKDPYAFFVLNSQFLIANKAQRPAKDTKKNFYFPSRVIVNAKILNIPEKIHVTKPVRRIERVGNKVQPKITLEEADEKNLIGVPEACFSFTHMKPRTTERYFRIRVRYQYPVKLLGLFPVLWRKTEWVEGLKAHIFQHEIDHANAKNMYYDKR